MKKMIKVLCIGVCSVSLVACGTDVSKETPEVKESVSEIRESETSQWTLEKIYASLLANYTDIKEAILNKVEDTQEELDKKVDQSIEKIDTIQESLKENSSEAAKKIDQLAEEIKDKAKIAQKTGTESFSDGVESIQDQFESISQDFFDNEFTDTIKESIEKSKEKLGID